MKIRNGYVSNSSSSSFVICGKNIKQILVNAIANIQETINFDFWEDCNVFTLKEINEEILRQIKLSNANSVKNVINGLITNSQLEYQNKIFWQKISKKRCNIYYDFNFPESEYYDKVIKNTMFELNGDEKTLIEKSMLDIYHKTNSVDSWSYYIRSNELDKLIEKHSELIYEQLTKNGNEIYVVSFGDNHGACTGALGWFVESEYLGQKTMNSYLNANFEIYHLNEH